MGQKTTDKPRKKDFTCMGDFMRASSAWAEGRMKEWPWGGPKDEDDDYVWSLPPRSVNQPPAKPPPCPVCGRVGCWYWCQRELR